MLLRIFPREGEEIPGALRSARIFYLTCPRPNLTDWSDLNGRGRQFNTVYISGIP